MLYLYSVQYMGFSALLKVSYSYKATRAQITQGAPCVI